MRTEEALVVNMWKIIDNAFFEIKDCECVVSLHDNTFEYVINEIVKTRGVFNPRLDTVCVSGIHFLLNRNKN